MENLPVRAVCQDRLPSLSQIHRGTAANGLCVNKQDAVLNVAAIFVIFIISYIEKMKGCKSEQE